MIERQPSITEGHDGGARFWIMPVRCHSTVCFGWDDVEEHSPAEISLDEFDVDVFLRHFFINHFDKDLIYNQQRKQDWSGAVNVCEPAEFEWYLTHNFYTRNKMMQMLEDISAFADTLELDGFDSANPLVTCNYNLYAFFDIDRIDAVPEKENQSILIKDHIHVAVDYYRCFARRVKIMLDENPDWPLISIMGP